MIVYGNFSVFFRVGTASEYFGDKKSRRTDMIRRDFDFPGGKSTLLAARIRQRSGARAEKEAWSR